jgi:phosphotransferase system enzyme I (PtsP)
VLNTLKKIVQEFAQQADFAASVRLLAKRVRNALGTEVCSIYLLNETRDGYRLVATEGLNEAQIGEVILAHNQGLVGLVGRRAEPLNLDAAQEHPNFHFVPEIGEEPFNSFLGVPIMHKGRVLGVLVVQQRDQRRFDEGEEAFMITLSAQLATVVAHAEAVGDSIMFGRKRETGVEGYFRGLPGSPGIAIGTSVVLHPIANFESVPERSATDVTVELTLLDRALEAVRNDIRGIIEEFKTSLPPEELALFDAYLHMLDDNALAGDIRDRVRLGQWAQGALKQVIREHVGRFELMDDPYLKERGSDVKDLGVRILGYLQRIREKKTQFPKDTILVGEEVTPSMLTSIPAERLRGVVSLRGSGSSHVSILARAMDIPAVMGAVDLPGYDLEGVPLIVDGHYGEVYTNPSKERLQENRTQIAEQKLFE